MDAFNAAGPLLPFGHDPRGRRRGWRAAPVRFAALVPLLASAPAADLFSAEGEPAKERAAPERSAPESPAPERAARSQIPQGAALPLLGRDVKGPSGQVVAQIVNVLVDEAGRPLAAVLDYGGFMGVGRRRIAVAWEALRFAPGEKDGAVVLDLTRDQLREFPEHKKGEPAVVAAPAAAAAPK